MKNKIHWVAFAVIAMASCNKEGRKLIVFGDVINVVIDSTSRRGNPVEPSICIDPNDKNHIFAASILDNMYESKDGGLTWLKSQLKSTYGVFGDPVVRFDFRGNLFYAHLANSKGKAYSSVEFLDRMVVQNRPKGATEFSNGSYPPCDTIKDHDKQWLYVDPEDNTVMMTWTEFDKYGSNDENDRSKIMFSKSVDAGKTWTPALKINELDGGCLDDDQTTEGAVPAAGVNGEYYVVWAYDNKIYFDKSMDKGMTWMQNDQVIAVQKGGWTFEVPGINRCNGMPSIKVDHSKGKNRGTLYVQWSDQSNGKDDTDIWIIKSTDRGNTWTQPMRVNNDETKTHQFFSSMDVDNSNGDIALVFYDRRNYKDDNTDTYLAISKDGALSFQNFKLNKQPFRSKASLFFGDYTDISISNGRIRPIWNFVDGSKVYLYTALIDIK
jgi:hypothetical protein